MLYIICRLAGPVRWPNVIARTILRNPGVPNGRPQGFSFYSTRQPFFEFNWILEKFSIDHGKPYFHAFNRRFACFKRFKPGLRVFKGTNMGSSRKVKITLYGP